MPRAHRIFSSPRLLWSCCADDGAPEDVCGVARSCRVHRLQPPMWSKSGAQSAAVAGLQELQLQEQPHHQAALVRQTARHEQRARAAVQKIAQPRPGRARPARGAAHRHAVDYVRRSPRCLRWSRCASRLGQSEHRCCATDPYCHRLCVGARYKTRYWALPRVRVKTCHKSRPAPLAV